MEKILCVGEILWDALPSGLFLGGAPLNVGSHLHQLGEDVAMVSRVGDDRLGNEAIRRIKQKELSTELIQRDQQFETGFVEVEVDGEGDPNYTIVEPVAWDKIELTHQIKLALDKAWAVVFGSLAQRKNKSRETIHFIQNIDTLKVFDANLREPFYNKEIIEASIQAADILKLNEEELQKIITLFSFPATEKKAIRAIAEFFDCSTITVTKGGQGAILFHNDEWMEHRGFDIQVKDTVGAGDAFLAALLQGIRLEKKIEELLLFANAAGALTASQFGGIPEYNYNDVDQLIAKYKVERKTKV